MRAFPPLSAALGALMLLRPAWAAPTLLDPNALPDCAMNCATLNAAAAGCLPPAADKTNQATYDSCFCQSSLLTTLYSSTTGICDTECAATPDDLTQMQQWYKGFCRRNGAAPPAAPPTTTSSTTSSTPTPTDGSPASTDVASAPLPDENTGSWVSTHWQWIIFLVVIIVAIILLTLLLLWLKKRHQRRRDQRISLVAGPGARHDHNDTRDYNARPEMAAMSRASASPEAVAPPPITAKSRARTSSLRYSLHSASKDSLGQPHSSLGRSGSRPGSAFQPPAPVWGPHQNQHHAKGYGYDDPQVPVPPAPFNRSNPRGSWGVAGPSAHGESQSQEPLTLREEDEEEERLQTAPQSPASPASNLAEGVRRKLSKRRS